MVEAVMNHVTRICIAVCATLSLTAQTKQQEKAELLEAKAIWGRAPHNAFTDLIRFKDRWYCTFREGQAHVSPDGALRVLTSTDGEVWLPAARLTSETADLRDPKLSITPNNRLMLNAGATLHQPSETRRQSMVWFSSAGRRWSGPTEIGDPNMWLWRVTWLLGRAYSIGYNKEERQFLRLYTSTTGSGFEVLADNIFDGGGSSESTMLFLADYSALCLLRREGENPTARLGKAVPPYRAWTWKDLGIRLGGPNMIQLPDNRIVAAGRLYDGERRTSLCWLDPEEDRLTEFLRLPSGGDTSYPGLFYHDRLLWVSYYSSHEGKTMIYLAKVKLPQPET
jgi:hypothetical protein